MIALLQRYSLSDILMFTVFLALAIKSLICFFDWGNNFLRRIFNKEHANLNKKNELERRVKKGDEKIFMLQENQKTADLILQDLQTKIDMLINSDKDSIKSYITKEHHYFCYQQKWIDDFSLDCIEKRFEHYEDQGGNSFIEGLMNELRNLPRQSSLS